MKSWAWMLRNGKALFAHVNSVCGFLNEVLSLNAQEFNTVTIPFLRFVSSMKSWAWMLRNSLAYAKSSIVKSSSMKSWAWMLRNGAMYVDKTTFDVPQWSPELECSGIDAALMPAFSVHRSSMKSWAWMFRNWCHTPELWRSTHPQWSPELECSGIVIV